MVAASAHILQFHAPLFPPMNEDIAELRKRLVPTTLERVRTLFSATSIPHRAGVGETLDARAADVLLAARVHILTSVTKSARLTDLVTVRNRRTGTTAFPRRTGRTRSLRVRSGGI